MRRKILCFFDCNVWKSKYNGKNKNKKVIAGRWILKGSVKSADNKMTIQLDEDIANTYKTVRK